MSDDLKAAAKKLDFEKAALLRDRIVELRKSEVMLDYEERVRQPR